MLILVLSILDTEWPALLTAGGLGLGFVLVRAYRQNRKK